MSAKNHPPMDRKLVMELLRIAVTCKYTGKPNGKWKTEHWDHLERAIESVVIAQQQKWGGPLDGNGKSIVGPNIRTVKNFLSLSPEAVLRIRTSTNDREGIPETNTQDYLVRLLGFPMENRWDFAACMEALQLHPDNMRTDASSLLDLISGHFQTAATASGAGNHPKLDTDESEQDAAMDEDAVEKRRHSSTTQSSPFDLGAIDDLEGAHDQENETAGEDIHRNALGRKVIMAGLVAILGVIGLFSLSRMVGWWGAPPVSPPVQLPTVSIHTEGRHSPGIYAADGDVNYSGNHNTCTDFDTLDSIHR